MDDVITCENCGHVNDIGRASCDNCHVPFTAYGGQLTGEPYEDGKLAEQVAKLEVRPVAVCAVVGFDIFFALFWPFAYVVGGFMGTQGTNAEGTNAIGAAFSWVGPLLSALVLIPFGVALLVVAGLTWTQRPVAWTINVGVLGLFALLCLKGLSFLSVCVFLPAAIVLAFLWFQKDTKAWFGMM